MLTFPSDTRLNPVNVCIYCGATAAEITLDDEHIIPLSLGGIYILPKASCRKCAKAINKGFEGYAGRHIFQNVRVEHGFPTRHPKERPDKFPLRESFSPSPELAPVRLVPTNEYPGSLILMNPEPAGVLLGHSPDQETKIIPFVRQITGRDRIEALKARGIKALVYREIRPDRIARLYAKIALGFAVAGPGLQSFEPVILDAILREDSNPFYWVGGTTQDMYKFPPPKGPLLLHRVIFYMHEIERIPHLLSQIQLFAYLDAPIFTIVVGKLTKTGMNEF
jgi:hypothetical protein